MRRERDKKKRRTHRGEAQSRHDDNEFIIATCIIITCDDGTADAVVAAVYWANIRTLSQVIDSRCE